MWKNKYVLSKREYISGHRWEGINMDVKCIVHMHITAELKHCWLLVYFFAILLETASFESAYLLCCLCLPSPLFYFWHYIMLLALVKITLMDVCIHIYCACLCYYDILLCYIHMWYISQVVVHSDGLYTGCWLVTLVLSMTGY